MSLASVIANLNAQALKIKTATAAGLVDAGLFIKAESMKNAPVDTGNLRASHFSEPNADGSVVTIGATANYAGAVHETHKTKGKFLEKAVKENSQKILKRIGRHAKI